MYLRALDYATFLAVNKLLFKSFRPSLMQRWFKGLPVFLSSGKAVTSTSVATTSFIRCSAKFQLSIQRTLTNDALKLDKRKVEQFEERLKKTSPEDRTKENFLAAAAIFKNAHGRRSVGYLEYITTALRYLEEYGLHKDLDVYKALLNCFPKGVLIPTNRFQKIFMHHPHQQVCCVTILDQMEWFGVYPDKEIHDIVVNAFGEWNYATKKAKRMLYWMPKLKYTNKYLDYREAENRDLKEAELARLALRMMCRDSGTVFSYVKTPSSELDFGKWIVSAQSPLQQNIIRKMPGNACYFVDGPTKVYVTDKPVNYVVFSSAPSQSQDEEFVDQCDIHEYSNIRQRLFDQGQESEKNIHQQSDQTILAMAVMEENTQATASAWVNHLQTKNIALEKATVLFRIREKRAKL